MWHVISKFVVWFLVAALAMACGAPPARTVSVSASPVAITTQTSPRSLLNNGLEVRTIHRPLDETIAVQLWLPAGARYEGEAPAGVAAAVAELTRRSAARLLPSTASLASWVESDSTVFSLVTTPADLDETLDVLATAVSTLDTTEEHLRSTRLARERAQAHRLSSPAHRILGGLLAEAYSPNGLGRSPLGGDPAAWDPRALLAFHGAHYGPVGAHLVFVGPASNDTCLGRARSHWQRWTGKTTPRPTEADPKPAPRIRVDRSDGSTGLVRLALRLKIETPREAAIYDLMAQLLGKTETGRLPRSAKHLRVPLTQQRAYVFSPVGTGQLIIELDGPSDAPDQLWSVAAQGLASLREIPPSTAELMASRKALLAADSRQRATPDEFAEHVGRAMVRWPKDPERAAWREAVSSLSAETVATEAAKLLHRERVSAIVLAPQTTNEDDGFWAEALWEKLAVIEGQPPVSNGAGQVRIRPGLEVVAHPMPHTGVVAVHVLAGGGQGVEGQHQPGTALMAASLWETLGGRARVRLGPRTIEASLMTTPTDFEQHVLELVDGLRRARWSPAEFETARERAIGRVRTLRDHPALWARELAMSQVSHPLPALIEALQKMGATRVRPWFETHLAGADFTVSVVGAVPPDRAYRAVRAAFDGVARKAPGVSLRNTPEAAPMIRRTTDGGPAHRWFTFDLDVSSIEDRATLTLLETLLVTPKGQIATQVQEAFSGGQGRWGVGASGHPDHVATETNRLTRTLETLRAGVLPDEQVRQAIKQTMARETLRLRTPAVRARWLARQAEAGRPLTGQRAVALWRAAIGRVLAADVHRLVSTKLAKPTTEIRVGPGPMAKGAAPGATP